jgi:hypothetical protein
MAGASGFLIFSHDLLGPDRYGCPRCFEDYTLKAELAGVLKNGRPVPGEVLVEVDARVR